MTHCQTIVWIVWSKFGSQNNYIFISQQGLIWTSHGLKICDIKSLICKYIVDTYYMVVVYYWIQIDLLIEKRLFQTHKKRKYSTGKTWPLMVVFTGNRIEKKLPIRFTRSVSSKKCLFIQVKSPSLVREINGGKGSRERVWYIPIVRTTLYSCNGFIPGRQAGKGDSTKDDNVS